MISSEAYAQARLEFEALIRKHAPERFHSQLIDSLLPTIGLSTAPCDDTQIPIGASKFGGGADVPIGFEWPVWKEKSLGFVGQINLEEIAPFDIEQTLPQSGILAFFVLFDEWNRIVGIPEQREGWRVFFYENHPLQRVEPPADSHWIVPLYTQRIKSCASWTIEDLDLDWSEEEWFNFEWEVLSQIKHQMGGHPLAPQLSPFIIAENGSRGVNDFDLYQENKEDIESSEWKLLLQVDTDAEGFFEDIYGMGWFYFMIKGQDLKNLDFSKVWFNEQGT